jgi:hypothetical protein
LIIIYEGIGPVAFPIIGGGVVLSDIFGFVRPFFYAGSYNRMLSRSLLIVDAGLPHRTLVAYRPETGSNPRCSPEPQLMLVRIEL